MVEGTPIALLPRESDHLTCDEVPTGDEVLHRQTQSQRDRRNLQTGTDSET